MQRMQIIDCQFYCSASYVTQSFWITKAFCALGDGGADAHAVAPAAAAVDYHSSIK